MSGQMSTSGPPGSRGYTVHDTSAQSQKCHCKEGRSQERRVVAPPWDRTSPTKSGFRDDTGATPFTGLPVRCRQSHSSHGPGGGRNGSPVRTGPGRRTGSRLRRTSGRAHGDPGCVHSTLDRPRLALRLGLLSLWSRTHGTLRGP